MFPTFSKIVVCPLVAVIGRSRRRSNVVFWYQSPMIASRPSRSERSKPMSTSRVDSQRSSGLAKLVCAIPATSP
jgi:hypothetical protein